MARKPGDDDLLNELAQIARNIDPVPNDVLEQARASYSMASPWDTALAQLVYDSTTDGQDVRALVRDAGSSRELSFEGPNLSVEIEITSMDPHRDGRCHIMGQLVPATAAQVEVRTPDCSETFQADELGRFDVDDVPTGPMSIRCTPSNGLPTDTEWTVI